MARDEKLSEILKALHERDPQLIDEIDKQYSPSLWSQKYKPEEIVEIHFSFVIKESAIAKEKVQCTLDVKYAEGPASKIDFFGDKSLPGDAPILIFVHGGYWSIGCRQNSSFFVKPFVDAGVLCAVVGYDLVNDTVLVPDIVLQIKDAISYLLDYAVNRKSRGVFVCGHSAGAHLIMMAMSCAPKNDKYSLIKGMIPVSGIYDINPLLKTSYAEIAKLSEEIAKKCSPITEVNELKNNLVPSTKIFVAVGDHESPAFKEQSESYHTLLKSSSLDSEFLLINEDHFGIVELLGKADFILTEKILELIKKDESG